MVLRKISCGIAGGAVGALFDSFNIWILGKLGVTSLLGIALQPKFTASWLYPRLVWGGIWGLLFMVPILEKSTVLRGMVLSIAPSATVLFVVFPGMGRGMFGLGFGTFTPVLVVFLNFIWGIVAAFWYKNSAEKKEPMVYF
jgi:hypothetical protein